MVLLFTEQKKNLIKLVKLDLTTKTYIILNKKK